MQLVVQVLLVVSALAMVVGAFGPWGPPSPQVDEDDMSVSVLLSSLAVIVGVMAVAKLYGLALATGLLISSWMLVGYLGALAIGSYETGWGAELAFAGSVASVACSLVLVCVNRFRR